VLADRSVTTRNTHSVKSWAAVSAGAGIDLFTLPRAPNPRTVSTVGGPSASSSDMQWDGDEKRRDRGKECR